MAEAPPRTEAAPRSRLRRIVPLLALLAGGLGAFALWGDRLSFETLRDNRAALLVWRDAAPVATAAAYVGAYVAVVAFSIPGAAAMTLTGGFLFGPLLGGALAVVGATVGATILFLAARAGFGDALRARLLARGDGGALARFEAGLRENEASYLLLMRLVPAVPFFVANLAPAFLGVRARTFVWTTFVGIMPGGFVYAWIGSGLGAVFDRGATPDRSLLADPRIVAPTLALAALAALPIVVKALRRRRAAG
jgi:uncharacterized membrane protein YdjX (TVP38/TMEM64 family)